MDSLPFQEEKLMHRFFTDPDRTAVDTAFLASEDAKHALTVLRLKTGQTIEVFSGCRRFTAKIISTDNHEILVRLLSPLPSTEAALSVTLYQSIPKSDKMDWIVQKATELGVKRIVPVNMSRCVVRINSGDSEKKLERWRRIAREAGKQSGRCSIPVITEPCAPDLLSSLPEPPEINIVPWEDAVSFGPLSFHQAYPSIASMGILIGPEGGIEPAEIHTLRTYGFIPITLGKRILRTETAGLAAVSAFMSLYGEME